MKFYIIEIAVPYEGYSKIYLPAPNLERARTSLKNQVGQYSEVSYIELDQAPSELPQGVFSIEGFLNS